MNTIRIPRCPRGAAMVLAGFVLFLSAPALATSGIAIVEDPVQITPDKPPCNAERITTFRMKIRNTNDVCNEFVKIREATLLDMKTSMSPLGSLDFLGFKTSQNGPLVPSIDLDDMEDETTFTFYFDVKTAPVTIGPAVCDFEFAEFGIRVCDHDGGCDWGSSSDPPCPIGESPTPLIRKIRLEADDSFCPPPDTGTGTIRGIVENGQGAPIAGARVTAIRVLDGMLSCAGNPEHVLKTTETKKLPWDERGEYEITGLLYPPGDYEVTARDAGRCQSVTVTLPPSGELVQDFVLTLGCP